MTAQISAESIFPKLYRYEVELRGWDDVLDQANTAFTHTIRLEDVPTLILHLLNAERDLRDRKVADAVCGPCKKCSNIRMGQFPTEPHGRIEYTDCPTCGPKIRRAKERGLI